MSSGGAQSERGAAVDVTANVCALIDNLLVTYPTSFPIPREMFQNADDAKATSFSVRLHSLATPVSTTARSSQLPAAAAAARLVGGGVRLVEYCNDGERFTQPGWQRIQEVGTGNPDSQSIGQYGVGLYSIFDVSDSPAVLSGGTGRRFIRSYKPDRLQIRHEPYSAEDPLTRIQMPLKTPQRIALQHVGGGQSTESDTLDLIRSLAFFARAVAFAKHVRQVRVLYDGVEVCELRAEVESESAYPAVSQPIATEHLAILHGVRVQQRKVTMTDLSPGQQLLGATATLSAVCRVLLAEVTERPGAEALGLRRQLWRKTGKRPEERLTVRLIAPTSSVLAESGQQHPMHEQLFAMLLPLRCASPSGSSMARAGKRQRTGAAAAGSAARQGSGLFAIGQPTETLTGWAMHVAARFYTTFHRTTLATTGDSPQTAWNVDMLSLLAELGRADFEALCDAGQLQYAYLLYGWPRSSREDADAASHLLVDRFLTARPTLRLPVHSASASDDTLTSSIFVASKSHPAFLDQHGRLAAFLPMSFVSAALPAGLIRKLAESEHGLVRAVASADVLAALRATALSEPQLASLLIWLSDTGAGGGASSDFCSHQDDIDTLLRSLNLQSSVGSATGRASVVPWSAFSYFCHCDVDVPLGANVLPHSVVRAVLPAKLQRFGLRPLPLKVWLRHISTHPASLAPLFHHTRLLRDVKAFWLWLSRAYVSERPSTAAVSSVSKALRDVACLPTRSGCLCLLADAILPSPEPLKSDALVLDMRTDNDDDDTEGHASEEPLVSTDLLCALGVSRVPPPELRADDSSGTAQLLKASERLSFNSKWERDVLDKSTESALRKMTHVRLVGCQVRTARSADVAAHLELRPAGELHLLSDVHALDDSLWVFHQLDWDDAPKRSFHTVGVRSFVAWEQLSPLLVQQCQAFDGIHIPAALRYLVSHQQDYLSAAEHNRALRQLAFLPAVECRTPAVGDVDEMVKVEEAVKTEEAADERMGAPPSLAAFAFRAAADVYGENMCGLPSLAPALHSSPDLAELIIALRLYKQPRRQLAFDHIVARKRQWLSTPSKVQEALEYLASLSDVSEEDELEQLCAPPSKRHRAARDFAAAPRYVAPPLDVHDEAFIPVFSRSTVKSEQADDEGSDADGSDESDQPDEEDDGGAASTVVGWQRASEVVIGGSVAGAELCGLTRVDFGRIANSFLTTHCGAANQVSPLLFVRAMQRLLGHPLVTTPNQMGREHRERYMMLLRELVQCKGAGLSKKDLAGATSEPWLLAHRPSSQSTPGPSVEYRVVSCDALSGRAVYLNDSSSYFMLLKPWCVLDRVNDSDDEAVVQKKIHDMLRRLYKAASLNDSVQVKADRQSIGAALLDKKRSSLISQRSALLVAQKSGAKWANLERQAEAWLKSIRSFTVQRVESTLSLGELAVRACLSSCYCAKPAARCTLDLYCERGEMCVVDAAEQLAQVLLNSHARGNQHTELVNHINMVLSTADLSRLALKGYNLADSGRLGSSSSSSSSSSPAGVGGHASTHRHDSRTPSTIFADHTHRTLSALSQLYSPRTQQRPAEEEEVDLDDTCMSGTRLSDLVPFHSHSHIPIVVRSDKDSASWVQSTYASAAEQLADILYELFSRVFDFTDAQIAERVRVYHYDQAYQHDHLVAFNSGGTLAFNLRHFITHHQPAMSASSAGGSLQPYHVYSEWWSAAMHELAHQRAHMHQRRWREAQDSLTTATAHKFAQLLLDRNIVRAHGRAASWIGRSQEEQDEVGKGVSNTSL